MEYAIINKLYTCVLTSMKSLDFYYCYWLLLMIRVWKESIKLLQDFGIDKNLSERIMDMAIENLDPVRGSLEKVRSA